MVNGIATVEGPLYALTSFHRKDCTGEGLQVHRLDICQGPIRSVHERRRNSECVEASIRRFTPVQVVIQGIADHVLTEWFG